MAGPPFGDSFLSVWTFGLVPSFGCCEQCCIERGNADIRYTNLYQIAEAFGLKISELLDFKL